MGEVPLYSCTPEALLQPECRGTSLIRNNPPPQDHHRTLCVVLL